MHRKSGGVIRTIYRRIIFFNPDLTRTLSKNERNEVLILIFEINQIVVDIDVEATRTYYTQVDRLNDCSCDGCVNYRQYTKERNNKIKDFFYRKCLYCI